MSYKEETVIVRKTVDKEVKDADRIIALALLKHLYNKGEISECVFRKIRKSTMEKISVENRELI